MNTVRALPIIDPPMPAAAEPALPAEDPRSSRWDLVLVLAMGGALLIFGWADTTSYLVGLHKLSFSFSMNARPGGVRVGETQEIFRHATDDSVRLDNFTELEHRGSVVYRHSLGPVSTLEIVTRHSHARLGFRFENVIADQDLVVACNGKILERITHLPLDASVPRLYAFDLQPGPNVVTFTHRRYNHHESELAPDDSRPVGGTFSSLDLLLE